MTLWLIRRIENGEVDERRQGHSTSYVDYDPLYDNNGYERRCDRDTVLKQAAQMCSTDSGRERKKNPKAMRKDVLAIRFSGGGVFSQTDE